MKALAARRHGVMLHAPGSEPGQSGGLGYVLTTMSSSPQPTDNSSFSNLLAGTDRPAADFAPATGSRYVVGIIGTGFNAREHAHRLSQLRDVTLNRVYDIDPDKAGRFAQDFGTDVAASIDEVVAECSAVFICTWTSEHVSVIETVVRAGLPVFCEKPLGRNFDEARRATELVQGRAVTNQVGLVLRYSPAFFWLEHLIADPRSGRLLALSWRSDQCLPANNHYGSTWRMDRERAGAGVLLEHSIHDIDMIEQLVGRLDALTCLSRQIHGLDGIDDVDVLGFRTTGGVIGSLTTVWHDIRERLERRRVEVFCERMWCALDSHYHLGPVTWQFDGEDPRTLGGDELVEAARSQGLLTDNEDAAFIAAARDNKRAEPSFVDALRAHEVVEVAFRSARRGGVWLPATLGPSPAELDRRAVE
jgi:predicted dehydrogenase